MAIHTFLILLSVIGITRSAGPNLSPTFSSRFNPKECTTKAGVKGICVDNSICNDDYVIEHGGIFHESELRSSDSCQGAFLWCCTEANANIPPPVTKNNECFARQGDYCPWCVSLYRSETNDISQPELFCAGLLIGSKVVLTTATCHVVSSSQTVWARFPDFAEPKKYYKLTFEKQHDNYNSGSHEYDLAFFTLNEEVKWKGESKGACLSLSTPVKPLCFSFGYDASDNLISTLVEVTKGSCIPGVGMSVDGFCAKAVDNDPCFVVTGAPVICPGNTNNMIVYGLARSPCRKAGANIGAFNFSSQWLKKELQGLGLNESNYVLNWMN